MERDCANTFGQARTRTASRPVKPRAIRCIVKSGLWSLAARISRSPCCSEFICCQFTVGLLKFRIQIGMPTGLGASGEGKHDDSLVRWPVAQRLEPALHIGQIAALDRQA